MCVKRERSVKEYNIVNARVKATRAGHQLFVSDVYYVFLGTDVPRIFISFQSSAFDLDDSGGGGGVGGRWSSSETETPLKIESIIWSGTGSSA